MKNAWKLLLAVCLTAVVLWGCGGDAVEETTAPAETEAEAAARLFETEEETVDPA